MNFLIIVVQLLKKSVSDLEVVLILFRLHTGSQMEEFTQVANMEEMEEGQVRLRLMLIEEKRLLECLVEVVVQLIK